MGPLLIKSSLAKFLKAYQIGKVNEGGWCHIPGDSGGETYEGIARNSWPDWAGWAKIDAWKATNGSPKYNEIISDVDGLDEDVMAFYKENFWDSMHGDEIASDDVAAYFYDWFINSRAAATKHLQKIVGIEPQTGHFGPATLEKVNEYGEALLDDLHASRDQFYTAHVAAVPKDAKFLTEWLKRSDKTYKELKSAA